MLSRAQADPLSAVLACKTRRRMLGGGSVAAFACNMRRRRLGGGNNRRPSSRHSRRLGRKGLRDTRRRGRKGFRHGVRCNVEKQLAHCAFNNGEPQAVCRGGFWSAQYQVGECHGDHMHGTLLTWLGPRPWHQFVPLWNIFPLLVLLLTKNDV